MPTSSNGFFGTIVLAAQGPTARCQMYLGLPLRPPTDAQGNFIPMSQWDPNQWPPHIHQPKEKSV